MKKMILLSLLGIIGISQVKSQNMEVKVIKEVITSFSKAGDQNDSDKLATYLDDNYRVVMNQLFGSKAVIVIPKAVYLDKIKSKEWGGDKRILTISDVNVNGNTAMAKVIFKGSKMTFVSLITLVKDSNGKWKLISDIPVIS